MSAIHEVEPREIESVIPLLRLAEPSEGALRWSIGNLSDTVYALERDGNPVAAATVRWEGDPSEIVELGVAESMQGKGVGREMVAWLLDEARRRGKRAMEVGTSNASIGNIAFYQKVGFRMHHVRQDYFWYGAKRVENGIVVRDLLVFRAELHAPQGDASGTRSGRRTR